MIKIKYVILDNNAVKPKYARSGDAGADLTATNVDYDENSGIATYGTGLAFSIPQGYVGLLFPRSSVYKQDLTLANSVGVIDSGYRGEVMFKYRATRTGKSKTYKIGDRVGQIVFVKLPETEFEQVEQLDRTERGGGSFGSTGI